LPLLTLKGDIILFIFFLNIILQNNEGSLYFIYRSLLGWDFFVKQTHPNFVIMKLNYILSAKRENKDHNDLPSLSLYLFDIACLFFFFLRN